MKVGTEDRKKLVVAGVVGFCALLALYPLYQELFGGPSTPVAVAPVPMVVAAPAMRTEGAGRAASVPPGFAVGPGAPRVGTASGQLDPTLHMEAMRVTEALVYTGTGRNIFAGGPAGPVKIARVETAKFPPRPSVPGPAATSVVPGPAPPPPINLKFFGTATAKNGTRRAFLLNGDDVFLASPGDVVQRRYRVVAIAANSITVEDIPNSNKQTLPLLAN